jgi:hypothetical protein
MNRFLNNLRDLCSRKSAKKYGNRKTQSRVSRDFKPGVEHLEDRLVPTVTYHGGALLQNVGIETLFFGQNWSSDSTLYQQAARLNGFLQYLTNSSYMDMLTNAGYGVGRGTAVNGPISLANLSGIVDDTRIQGLLADYINAGFIQFPDSNRLYFVYVDPGIEVSFGGETSGHEFGINHFLGYHYSFLGPGDREVSYAIIPYPGGVNVSNANLPDPFDGMTCTSSHELAEGVTDPQPNGIPGWIDDQLAAANQPDEIGDICNNEAVYLNNYAVQEEANQFDQCMIPSGATLTRHHTDLSATALNITATAGQTFSEKVATFADPDLSGSPSDYTVTITWGDGQTSTWGDGQTPTLQVFNDGNGSYSVFGSHTYLQVGSYTITVQIGDSDSDTAIASSVATVVPPPLTATGMDVSASAGQSFTGVVASFTDSGFSGSASSYSATITWGDGNTSAGTVIANGQGDFNVIGSDTFQQEGRYTATVTITGNGGSAMATSIIHVARTGAPPVHLHDAASSFTHSDEYYSIIVTTAYQDYLGRTPAPLEVAGWIRWIGLGHTDEQLEAGFIGSPEYYNHAGGTDQTWVTSMYHDLLGRTPADWEVNAWLQAMNGGMTRNAVAYGFAASPEREGIVVRNDYQNFLGRQASDQEVAGWVAVLENHTATNEQVVAGFVSSSEYFGNHYANAADWLFSAYHDILGRLPDPVGYNAWLGYLQSS